MKCPACGEDGSKVIYYGLPMKLCLACHTLWGWWSSFVASWPYNGVMFHYEGSYIVGLWHWIFDEPM